MYTGSQRLAVLLKVVATVCGLQCKPVAFATSPRGLGLGVWGLGFRVTAPPQTTKEAALAFGCSIGWKRFQQKLLQLFCLAEVGNVKDHIEPGLGFRV